MEIHQTLEKATKILNDIEGVDGAGELNEILGWLKYVNMYGIKKTAEVFLSDIENNYADDLIEGS
jgi:hypothetical protein